MPFAWTLRIAVTALGRNRVRSTLTMLGVIIGVASVIAMVSLGQGAQAQVQADIASMGSNILYVWPGSSKTGGARGGAGSVNTLTAEDVKAILAECPAVKMASPTVSTSAPLVFGNQSWNSRAEGSAETFPLIRNWSLASGAFFTEADVRTAARVAVLGKTVVDNLFPGMDPVGQTIRVRNLPFQVVGVLVPKGQNQWGQDQDDTIVLPWSTVQRKLMAINYIQRIMVSAVSATAASTAEEQVTNLLRQRHHITPDRDDDFQVRNLTDLAETAKQTQQTMTMLLGSIAGVSLLVGGIGIMNIMLVSVTERTREIGLRVALGARKSQVRMQFLAESIMLSTVGGLIGVIAGVAVSYGLATFFNWPMLLSTGAVGVSVIFSGLVGMVFGYYPASKASSLDPIDALRYE
jgi:putative ABC transport system permease protein